MARVEVVGLRVELPSNQPVLVLREVEGRRRVLTIYIGGPEASAIHTALEGTQPPRPLTHDLSVMLIEALAAKIDRVIITEIRDQTYFAEIVLRTSAGEVGVSGRPSDAVALAVRAGAGIFASVDLLDEVGRELSEDEPESEEAEEAVVDEFRDFLETISPEDFSDPTS
ncbi:MAG: bifunctional nuclease family protein [Acidobacteria bacterium]|nr:bifunctional nuclease family protein [Acidobacteriota bacterium]